MAHDGAEALRKLYADGVDAALLDVMMPGVDGLTVCKTIGHAPSMNQLPIIMMSAPHSAMLQAKPCGNAVLPKPFDLARLINPMPRCPHPTKGPPPGSTPPPWAGS